MAVHALVRCVLVHDNLLITNRAPLHVAFATRNVRVPARQRQMGPRVMVKCGWSPALRIMAVGAVGLVVLGQKLAIVSILVASFTGCGRTFEARFVSRQRLVAFGAGHGPMGTQQRKLRLRVVKPVDVSPGLHGMAGFATKGLSIRPFPRHFLVEFALMRVLVASRAAHVLEVERENLVRASSKTQLMTIGTSHGRVGSRQWKTRIAVFGDRVRRTVPVLNRVAILAAILKSFASELAIVCVFVAIRTRRKFNFVNRIFPGWDVAFRAVHLNMFAP